MTLFDDENFFSDSWMSFAAEDLVLFPQLEIAPPPFPDLESYHELVPISTQSKLNPASHDNLMKSFEDARIIETSMLEDCPSSPASSDTYSSPPLSPRGGLESKSSIFSTLDSITTAIPWSLMTHKEKFNLAQDLSEVFKHRRISDCAKCDLTRIIHPKSNLTNDGTLDIDFSCLTDEKLASIQSYLKRVSYELIVGQELLEISASTTSMITKRSIPTNTIRHTNKLKAKPGRPRGRSSRINHLKQKELVSEQMWQLRQQNQRYFAKEQVVAVTRDDALEDEWVDVIG